eukprot:12439_1
MAFKNKPTLGPLYIIRFGTDGCSNYIHKSVWTIMGLLCCLWYNYITSNIDYFFVYACSSLLLGCGEYFRQGINVKGNITKGYFYSPKTCPLPNITTSLLRGFGEGGSYIILGLILADYYLNIIRNNALLLQCVALFIAFMFMTYKLSPSYANFQGCKVNSGRDILMIGTLVFMAILSSIDLWGLFTLTGIRKQRFIYTFIFSSILGVIWNLFAYWVGARYMSRDTKYCKPSESKFDQYFGLIYDGIIELAAVNMPFLVIYMKIWDD